MTREEIVGRFGKGLDCSQVVLMRFADELGYDEEELARMASAFGGGMFHGDTCGCVTGALMALGMKYGHDGPNEWEKKAAVMKKTAEFETAFAERCGSLYCRELTGFDFAVPGEVEKARASGVMLEKCPELARIAMEEAARLMED